MYKNSKKHLSVILVSSIVTVLSLSGCGNSSGGGWIPLANGSKATFGFQNQCNDIPNPNTADVSNPYVAQLTGKFQYKDHDQKISFHAVMNNIPYVDFDQRLTTCAVITSTLLSTIPDINFPVNASVGTYTPQPKTLGTGGLVILSVATNLPADSICTDPGSKGIYLQLQGGIYGGYTQKGCLAGGNITISD